MNRNPVIIGLAAALVAVLVGLSAWLDFNVSRVVDLRPAGDPGVIAPILPGGPLSFTFKTADRFLSGLRFQLASYARVNKSTLKATLYRLDSAGKWPHDRSSAAMIAEQTYSAAAIKDWAWVELQFNRRWFARQAVYALELSTPDADDRNCLGLAGYPGDAVFRGKRELAGKPALIVRYTQPLVWKGRPAAWFSLYLKLITLAVGLVGFAVVRFGGLVTAADRSTAREVFFCLIAAYAVAVGAAPITARTLLREAQTLTTMRNPVYFGQFYGLAQGRPAEYHPAAMHEYKAMLNRLEDRTVDSPWPFPFNLASLNRTSETYERLLVDNLNKDLPQNEWRRQTNPFYFPSSFWRTLNLYWLYQRFGLTGLHLALILKLFIWLGVAGLFFLTRWLTGSSLVSLISLGVLVGCFQLVEQAPGSSREVVTRFPLVLALLYLAGLATGKRALGSARGGRWIPWLLEPTAVASFAALVMVLFLIYPQHSYRNYLLISGGALLAGLIRRNLLLIARSFVLGGAAFLVLAPISQNGTEVYDSISRYNFAANSQYMAHAFSANYSIQPSAEGLPFGDNLLYLNERFDPLVQVAAPEMTPFITESLGSGRVLSYVLKNSPLDYIASLFRCFWIQISHHREIHTPFIYPSEAPAWSGLGFYLALLLAVAFLAVKSNQALRERPGLKWVLAAVLTWEIFGPNTLISLWHNHIFYSGPGLMVLACLIPGLAVAAWRGRRSINPGRLFRSKIVWVVALAALGPLFWAGGEIRKAEAVFRIQYPLFLGFRTSSQGLAPDQVSANLKKIAQIETRPGRPDMFAAWTWYVLAKWRYDPKVYPIAGLTETEAEKWHRQAVDQMRASYRTTLAHGKDQPLIPAYARYLGLPEWPEVFARALEQDPDRLFAAAMAFSLAGEEGLKREQRLAYARRFDQLYGRLLADSAALRPQFKARPLSKKSVAGSAGGFESEAAFILRPSQAIELDRINTFNSSNFKIAVYIRILEGEGRVVALFDGGSPSEPLKPLALLDRPSDHQADLTADDLTGYRVFEVANRNRAARVRLRLIAGPNGLKGEVRDLFPLIRTPRRPSI